uniref:ShKT domain-containing protein n=1 Tax=Meloidogyne hapla TaxID=6305 RepID=A0A1I8BES3_MELHA
MSNIQCAQCNKSSACNADPFFESQLFCWEKDFNKWNPNKGKRVCDIGFCFIGVDKNELVQGCGKCTEQQNLSKCINCSTPFCNSKEILPSPIKCFHQNTNFQPKTNKTCHHIYDSCYIARDIFWRVEQNCGECPTKYKNCVKCNNSDFCNKESLIPLITTKTSIITTTTKIKENKTFTTEVRQKSFGHLNKFQLKSGTLLIPIFELIYSFLNYFLL